MFRPARKWLHSLFLRRLLLVVVAGLSAALLSAQEKTQMFRVIAIAEHGGIHKPFVDRAKIWLDKLAADNNFAVDYDEDTAKYKLFIQLNCAPYDWTDRAQAAFIKYIEAKAVGSAFTTPHCSANSMATRCGLGSTILWAGFALRITSRHSSRAKSRSKTRLT